VTEIFGAATFFDGAELTQLLSRLALNLLVVAAIVGRVYYRRYRNREYLFTYASFNVITFFLCEVLSSVSVQLGFALGLFALFGILRYRTEPIRIRDLTYLFIVIGVAIINAMVAEGISVVSLLVVNASIVLLTVFLELAPSSKNTGSRQLLYDRLDLLRPENTEKLRADLRSRLGLEVLGIEITRIDMLRDSAEIVVSYVEPENPGPSDLDGSAPTSH